MEKVSVKEAPATVLLRVHLRELGLAYLEEHRFCKRLWRLDFYLPEQAIGIEIEGAVYARGRHTRGKGYEDDCTKYNHATMAGIRVLRFSSGQVLRGEARAFLEAQLQEAPMREAQAY